MSFPALENIPVTLIKNLSADELAAFDAELRHDNRVDDETVHEFV